MMKTKPGALVLHFAVPHGPSSTGDIVINASLQPYAFASAGVLVGLYGNRAHYGVPTGPVGSSPVERSRILRIQVRPRARDLDSRSKSSGLGGVRCIDLTNASRDVKAVIGGTWKQAVEKTTRLDEKTSHSKAEVDWENPDSFMTHHPEAASEVFAMLPAVDVMIASAQVGPETRRVALVPMPKLAELAEWGAAKDADGGVIVRGDIYDCTVDVRLPRQTYTLPAPLGLLVGRDRHAKGDHPLRREVGSPA